MKKTILMFAGLVMTFSAVSHAEDCRQAITLYTSKAIQTAASPQLAIEKAKQIVDLCPHVADFQMAYASTLQKAGQYSQALAVWKTAKGLTYSAGLNAQVQQYKRAEIALNTLEVQLQLKQRIDAQLSLDDLKEDYFNTTMSPELTKFVPRYQQLRQQFNDQMTTQPFNAQELQTFVQTKRTLSVEAPEISYQIAFDFNQSQPNIEGMQVLDQVAKSLADSQFQTIHVIGHTDQQGDDAYNLKLSQRRAESVVQLLQRSQPQLKGHLQAIGKGKTELLAHGTTEQDYRLNRRVAFIFK